MEWVVPIYSNSAIDRAGALFTKPKAWMEESDLEDVFQIVETHRASHSFPLLIFRIGLAQRARRIDPNATVAQRLKRLESVDSKLRRFPKMRLSHMQDIAGCRAVVRSNAMVSRLINSFKKSSIKHKLLRTDDYILQPRTSGYRGVHLIYRYYSDRKKTYNGLKIEVQLRSKLQHAWATAVETIDAFTGQALKSDAGQKEWRRFFALMGSYMALKEHTPRVPHTPNRETELRWRIMYLARTLQVDAHLQAYQQTLQHLERDIKGASYYLIELDARAWTVKIVGYKRQDLSTALDRYAAIEKNKVNQPGLDAVLVAASSLEELKRVYPNYLADTHVFLQTLTEVVMDRS